MGISPIVVSFQTLRHFPLNHDGVGEGVSTIIPPENSEDNMSNHILVGQFPLFFVENKRRWTQICGILHSDVPHLVERGFPSSGFRA